MFIREIIFIRLILVHWLMSKIIRQQTAFYSFLSMVFNIIFRQQHLPTGNSSSKSRLYKNILNWIHFGNQPSSVIQHIFPQPLFRLGQSTTCFFQHRISRFTISKLLAEIINGIFLLPCFIMLSQKYSP